MNLSKKISFSFPKNKKSKQALVIFIALLVSIAYPFIQPQGANASVTESFVRFDRLSTGAAITGTACLKTSTSGTETNVVLVFPLGWTISSTASNWTVSTSNLPTDPVGGGAATAWPGIGTASSVAGLNVVFPGTDLSTGTFYCFNFAGASSTIGSAGNDQAGQLKTQGGAPYVDSVNWATSIVASNADQIAVTASVSATMTFSLSGNAVNLGTLSTSGVSVGSSITQTVSTNARNGWTSWVKSANAGLTSSIASSTLASPGSQDDTPESLAAQAGYVLDVDTGSGCNATCVADEYEGSDANSGGHLSTTFQQTATTTAPANANTVSLIIRAKAGATTPAASDYADTLTLVAAGSF